jgi:hypothetical protein
MWSSGYDYGLMKRFIVTALVVCACVTLVGCGKPVAEVKGKTGRRPWLIRVGALCYVEIGSYEDRRNVAGRAWVLPLASD